jgi:hypothetical protein
VAGLDVEAELRARPGGCFDRPSLAIPGPFLIADHHLKAIKTFKKL